MLRALSDYFPAAPQTLPHPAYTVSHMQSVLNILAPLGGWTVDCTSTADVFGWLAPVDLSFEALPVVTHCGTNIHSARVAQLHRNLGIPPEAAIGFRCIALCCRATQGEWCLFIADRTLHRAALIDPSNARHPCISAALFKWLAVLWGPTPEWSLSSQWATVHWHPVP